MEEEVQRLRDSTQRVEIEMRSMIFLRVKKNFSLFSLYTLSKWIKYYNHI